MKEVRYWKIWIDVPGESRGWFQASGLLREEDGEKHLFPYVTEHPSPTGGWVLLDVEGVGSYTTGPNGDETYQVSIIRPEEKSGTIFWNGGSM